MNASKCFFLILLTTIQMNCTTKKDCICECALHEPSQKSVTFFLIVQTYWVCDPWKILTCALVSPIFSCYLILFFCIQTIDTHSLCNGFSHNITFFCRALPHCRIFIRCRFCLTCTMTQVIYIHLFMTYRVGICIIICTELQHWCFWDSFLHFGGMNLLGITAAEISLMTWRESGT